MPGRYPAAERQPDKRNWSTSTSCRRHSASASSRSTASSSSRSACASSGPSGARIAASYDARTRSARQHHVARVRGQRRARRAARGRASSSAHTASEIARRRRASGSSSPRVRTRRARIRVVGQPLHARRSAPCRRSRARTDRRAYSPACTICATVPTWKRVSPPPTSLPRSMSTTPKRASLVEAVRDHRAVTRLEHAQRQHAVREQHRPEREHRELDSVERSVHRRP